MVSTSRPKTGSPSKLCRPCPAVGPYAVMQSSLLGNLPFAARAKSGGCRTHNLREEVAVWSIKLRQRSLQHCVFFQSNGMSRVEAASSSQSENTVAGSDADALSGLTMK